MARTKKEATKTKETKQKHAGGRPRKAISKTQFESLCKIQCTQDEICAVLDVCIDTLDKWCWETYDESFSNIFNQKRQGGKTSLRRKQWLMAEHNPTMAIWLGKQFLGQRDNKDLTIKQKIDIEAIEAVEGFLNGNG